MRAVVRLELIADDFFYHQKHGGRPFDWLLHYMMRLGPDKSPSWLAHLVGHDGHRFVREWPNGVRDYSEANRSGSRGIFVYYALPDGIYEVNDRYHWNKVRRYYIRVSDATITEITREEAIACLKSATSASPS